MRYSITRREAIRGLGIAGIAAIVLPKIGRGQTTSTPMCVLTPAQTEGPYYFDAALLRRDITEGKPGVPSRLLVTVVEAASCAAFPNAVVDVWHADALGTYSGYANQGTAGATFLRGIQVTDGDGVAEFATVYPGWYRGRTTHIHLKVHVGASTAVTSQLYFPEDVTAGVYAQSPYSTHGQKDTSNAVDSVLRGVDESTVLLDVTVEDGVYVARLTIGLAATAPTSGAATATAAAATPAATPTPTAVACPTDASFAAALCEVAELRDLVDGAVADETLRERLLRVIDTRVTPRITQAETFATTGKIRRALALLRSAIGALASLQRILNGRAAIAAADDDTRTALIEAASQLGTLLESMRQTLM